MSSEVAQTQLVDRLFGRRREGLVLVALLALLTGTLIGLWDYYARNHVPFPDYVGEDGLMVEAGGVSCRDLAQAEAGAKCVSGSMLVGSIGGLAVVTGGLVYWLLIGGLISEERRRIAAEERRLQARRREAEQRAVTPGGERHVSDARLIRQQAIDLVEHREYDLRREGGLKWPDWMVADLERNIQKVRLALEGDDSEEIQRATKELRRTVWRRSPGDDR